MLKNIVTALSIAACLASSGLIYPATMEVTEITDELVTFATSEGFEYQEYNDGSDYFVGDLASMLMFSCGTRDITDDIIIRSRYSGFYMD